MKILFWIRKAKKNKVNTSPLYCRITVEGVRSPDFSTSVRVNPTEWNAKAQKIDGNSDSVKIRNSKLSTIKNRLDLIYLDLETKQVHFSARTIYDIYFGKKKDISFSEAIEMYQNYKTKTVKKESTKDKIKSLLKNISSYSSKNGLSSKIIHEISPSDIENMLFYFSQQLNNKGKKWSNDHIAKHLGHIKGVFKYCIKFGYMSSTNRIDFVEWHKDKPKDLIYLTSEELARLENFESVERLERIKDVFLFACYTGLSYSDLKKLSDDDFFTGIDGRKWLSISRQKTENPVKLPLIQRAVNIIDKYGGLGKLPILTNQKYNAYLKEIDTICKINKELTTHVARKTFCVMALNVWDVPIETVSAMAGHKKIQTTQKYYLTVLEKKISRDMQKVL
ncbi:MAG: site-specific integrase [Raineya sp.]|jgi:site-specific recombinase XerD|nr:site-specific integrase [Raineya sp.]